VGLALVAMVLAAAPAAASTFTVTGNGRPGWGRVPGVDLRQPARGGRGGRRHEGGRHDRPRPGDIQARAGAGTGVGHRHHAERPQPAQDDDPGQRRHRVLSVAAGTTVTLSGLTVQGAA